MLCFMIMPLYKNLTIGKNEFATGAKAALYSEAEIHV